MELTFFYPTRTYKEILRIERGFSSFICNYKRYLFKYVVDEKDGWYHVIECIGKKKYNWKCKPYRRHLFRHYIIKDYDHCNDHPVVSLVGSDATPYDSYINVNLVDKKYHVTTHQYKR